MAAQHEKVPRCVLGDTKLKVYILGVTTALCNKLQLSAASQCLVNLLGALILTGNKAVMKCSF